MPNEIIEASDLAALMCARLCHDLVSPVAALGAALDLLDDPSAEDMRDEALALLRRASVQSAAKIEFSRLAFGAGGRAGASLDVRELQRLTDNVYAGSKVAFEWKCQAVSLPKPAARTLLNLCLLGAEALPRGGVVTVEATASPGGERLRVVSEGKRARLTDDTVRALGGERPDDGFDGRSVQPYYTGLITRSCHGRADARIDGERVEFTALLSSEAPKNA